MHFHRHFLGMSRSHRLCVWKLEREFKGRSFPGSPGIYHPNIPTSITNNQDQTASRSPVVPGGVVAGCPTRSRSISVVVYLSLGTTLANELPAPVLFPFCLVCSLSLPQVDELRDSGQPCLCFPTSLTLPYPKGLHHCSSCWIPKTRIPTLEGFAFLPVS